MDHLGKTHIRALRNKESCLNKFLIYRVERIVNVHPVCSAHKMNRLDTEMSIIKCVYAPYHEHFFTDEYYDALH